VAHADQCARTTPEVLVHDDESVEVNLVVDAIATELPGLLVAVEALLAIPDG
jgi:hypothetical protein